MKKVVKINCDVRTFLYQSGSNKLRDLIKSENKELLNNKYLLVDEGYLDNKRIELNPLVNVFYVNIPETGKYITNTAWENTDGKISNYYRDIIGDIGYITDTGIKKKILTFEIEDDFDIDYSQIKLLRSSETCDFQPVFFPSEIVSYKGQLINTKELDSIDLGDWFDNKKNYIIDKDMNLLWS